MRYLMSLLVATICFSSTISFAATATSADLYVPQGSPQATQVELASFNMCMQDTDCGNAKCCTTNEGNRCFREDTCNAV